MGWRADIAARFTRGARYDNQHGTTLPRVCTRIRDVCVHTRGKVDASGATSDLDERLRPDRLPAPTGKPGFLLAFADK